jgi:predicted glycosyltransferase
MKTYLAMLESEPRPYPFKSVLITGPFMPKQKRKKINKRSRRIGVRTFHFFRQMEKILAAADLVVCMGGYNTLCEVLSQGTVSIVIPRETPRMEQTIRARIFQSRNLVEYIPWNTFSPQVLREKVFSLLENPQPHKEAIARFQLTGIESMRQRLHDIRNNKT